MISAITRLTILFLAAAGIAGSSAADSIGQSAYLRGGDCVILLHGLGRSSSSMKKFEERLTSDGFTVANVAYPSRSAPIEELANRAISEGLGTCRSRSSEKIFFVTHSLGGILLRYYLKGNAIDELRHSVMLAPPNQGSTAADVFSKIPGYRFLNGRAGFQLGTDENSVPLQLGPVDFDVGVIAGDRTIDPLTSLFLANPDDGKVSVESTKVEGMNDFLLVHHSHAFIMKSDEVIRQTRYYFDHGEFDRSAAKGAAGSSAALN